jgi:magnesium-transporting ATPase (P-type)
MDMLCSDKTGTLTLNKMVIQVLSCVRFHPNLSLLLFFVLGALILLSHTIPAPAMIYHGIVEEGSGG